MNKKIIQNNAKLILSITFTVLILIFCVLDLFYVKNINSYFSIINYGHSRWNDVISIALLLLFPIMSALILIREIFERKHKRISKIFIGIDVFCIYYVISTVFFSTLIFWDFDDIRSRIYLSMKPEYSKVALDYNWKNTEMESFMQKDWKKVQSYDLVKVVLPIESEKEALSLLIASSGYVNNLHLPSIPYSHSLSIDNGFLVQFSSEDRRSDFRSCRIIRDVVFRVAKNGYIDRIKAYPISQDDLFMEKNKNIENFGSMSLSGIANSLYDPDAPCVQYD